MQPDDYIHVIIIANDKLSESQHELLRSLGVTIERNFTLATWYEASSYVKDIYNLQNLDFVTQIKSIEDYEPLAGETPAKDNNDTSLLIPTVILLVIFAVAALSMKRKHYKILALALLVAALFSQIPVSHAEEGGIPLELNTASTGFQEAKNIELPEKAYPRIAQNQIKAKDNKVDPRILASGDDTVKVLVETTDEYTDSDLRYVQKTKMQEFQLGNFLYMEVPKSEINKLEKTSSVKKVQFDEEYKPLLDIAVPLINTGSFLANNFNGSGIKVCVLDTGVNKTHPALISRVVAEKDFVTTDSDGDNPADFHGHGTHVAGIVASNDSIYRGVAFGSSILNAKVFSSTSGSATTGSIISGIDWCISQGANILTLSLGGKDEQNDGSDVLSQYVDLAADQGKVVTIAAGNSGPSGDTSCRTNRDSSGSSYSVCEPGLAHKAITVGSTQTSKYTGNTNDGLSGFSSRGPASDNRIKPDVTAPGQVITSSWINGGYNSISGTSMATPVVAGLSALILQARNVSPEEVKTLLMNTAVDLGSTGKDNSYGAGRVNASRVFDEINNTVRDAIDTPAYKIHNIFVPSGDKEIRATLYWPENYSLHNDVDLYLLDPAGNVRTYSISSYNTDEIIKLPNPSPAGNWKLLVDPFNVSGNQVYSLASNFKPSGQMYLAATNVSNKIIYHQINVTNSSKKLIVDLDWNFTNVNLDIYLYNTSGHLVNYSNAVNTNYEEVIIDNPSTGIWLVRLVPSYLAGKAGVDYALTSTFAISSQITDDIPPDVTLIEPVNKTYGARNINSTFRAADNLNTFVDCYRNLDNTTDFIGTIQNNSLFAYNFSVSDGAHNISITCADTANNFGNSSLIYFSVDTIPPTITFVSPSDSNNSFVNRNHTFIGVNVADSNDIDSCFLEWNNVNQSMTKIGSGNSITCFLNKTDSDGTYSYKIYANDSISNSGYAGRVITFDTIYPVINNYTPSDYSSYSKGGQNESLSVNYTEINLDSVYFFWQNGSGGNFTQTNLTGCESGNKKICSANLNLSGFTEGTLIQFYFGVFDKTGKSSYLFTPSADPFSATIDRISPNVTISSIRNSQKFNSDNVTLNFTAIDNKLISSCSYKLNSNGDASITKNITFVAEQGNNTLIVSCTDSAGNKGNSSVAFFVDSVYPIISLQSPQNTTYNFNTSLKLNSTVNEANLDKIWYRLDNNENITLTENTTFSASEGSHVLYMSANDSVNNLKSTSIEFTIDITPIQVSFVSATPLNEILNMRNSITINVTTNGVPDSIVLEWNGTNETINGNGTNWFISKVSLSDGNYTFKAYLNDSVGNQNVSEMRWVFINVTRNTTSLIRNINQTLSFQNITVKILNSAGEPMDSSQLISFENYTLQFNISNVFIETANFLVNSLNSSAIVNITNNITAELNISAAFNKSGGSLDNYVWVDLNNLLPSGNFTAKIIFPRIYALYFYLNGTRDAPNITQVKSVCNINLSNIPCYNISANISTLYLPSFSGGAGGNDTQAPSISVSSPISGTTYSSSSIPLTYTVSDNVAVDKCWYSLNSGSNTTLPNCANATITASDGSNTLNVYANDTSNNLNQITVAFTFSQPVPTSSSGGGGGGGGYIPSQQTKQNQTNATTTAQKTEQQANKTVTISISNQTLVNRTAQITTGNETSNKNKSNEANQTANIGPSGFVIGSPENIVIGGSLSAIIVAGLVVWKFKSARKQRKK
ncbi:S8 family serine peptidase [archaeon]|nr:S8 family serine peptidase [archaeon]